MSLPICPNCSGALWYRDDDGLMCLLCARYLHPEAPAIESRVRGSQLAGGRQEQRKPGAVAVVQAEAPDTDRRCQSCHELRLIERYSYIDWKHHEQGRREPCMRCERKPRARGQAVA